MSQKPRTAAKPAFMEPTPITEPADAAAVSAETDAKPGIIAAPAETGSDPVSAEAAPEPVAAVAETVAVAAPVEVVAEAVVEPVPAAVETVAAVSPEPAPLPAVTRTAEPAATPHKTNVPVAAFAAFSQANLEAFAKSGQIWSAGIHELTQQIAETAKQSFDESVSALNAVSRAKSLHDAIELQTRFTRTAIATALKGTQQIAGASMKLTERTLAPLTDRVNVAVRSVNKAH